MRTFFKIKQSNEDELKRTTKRYKNNRIEKTYY